MGYSLYLVAATFLAAQDLDVVLVEPQEPIKPAPAKVQPKAKEDGKILPNPGSCEGGACGDGVVCCTTGCCDSCGGNGLLARLFSRGCGQRSGLFSFLRRNCNDCDSCSDPCRVSCDPCGSGGRRGLFGRKGCCEDMVMDACCRGMCCDVCSQSCSSRRGLFGFLRRGCNDGCDDACNICCDPCSSCCNQRRGLLGRFRRGCNDGCCGDMCGNMCCNMCGSCGGCGNCGSERRILGLFSRCRGGLSILRRLRGNCNNCNNCNTCPTCGSSCGQGACGADQPGKVAPKTKASLNGTQPGLFARLGRHMDGILDSNSNKVELPANANPLAVPHTALRMPKAQPEKTEIAKREQANPQDFQRIAVINPVIEMPKTNVPGQMGIGATAIFTTADAQQVSRNVEARPAIQLVAGIKPTSTRTAHDASYRWITGELQRYDGVWVLRYAASDSMDPFGGCAVLFPEVEMNGFREGDIVSVRGEVINSPGRGIRAAHYRATMVELIDR